MNSIIIKKIAFDFVLPPHLNNALEQSSAEVYDEGQDNESSTETFLSAQSITRGSRTRRSRRRAKFRRKQRQKRQREKPKPPDLFFNYTNIQLTEEMKTVLNLGPNFVPDRSHVNPVDINVGNLRMRRAMEWDAYFQLKEKGQAN